MTDTEMTKPLTAQHLRPLLEKWERELTAARKEHPHD